MREVNARINVYSELFLDKCTLGRSRYSSCSFSRTHRSCPAFTWIPPFSKEHHPSTKDRASYAYTRVHTRLRESAYGQTCRNNTVPEVANGWPARLFEMEVSNSRVKWPLYWSWWSSYGHKLSPVWFNCYRKPTQQQRCITTTRKKI